MGTPSDDLVNAVNLPTAIDTFFSETPLYTPADFTFAQGFWLFRQLHSRTFRFDTYCPNCQQMTTWTMLPKAVVEPMGNTFVEAYFEIFRLMLQRLEFQCSRVPTHMARFAIEVNRIYVRGRVPTEADSIRLLKFGQLPSLTDLLSGELRSYSKFFSQSVLRELNRSIGLAAHGVGIGAFVYLRRIFERLVNEAMNRLEEAGGISDREAANKLRMDEKLELLGDAIPEWMFKNRKLYAILSKGLHELTEDICLQSFPAVKLATFALLEQHAEVQRRIDRAREAEVALSKLHEALQKKT